MSETPLIGTSKAMLKLREDIAKVAQMPTTVLIQGQTGTGKELVAKEIHRLSGVKGRFVAINCAAIPSELLESELFGHEKGAFTGADKLRAGQFEQSEHGTLFLDEIGDMPLALQSKLLRVLEDRTFQRVGGRQNLEVTARLVFATHQNIEKNVEQGQFRADLYYRINVFPLSTPNLAQRKSDIPVIADHLMGEISRSLKLEDLEIDPKAVKKLQALEWPGNVRELRNFLERLIILCENKNISGQLVDELSVNSLQINKSQESDALWEAIEPPKTDSIIQEEDTNILNSFDEMLNSENFSLKSYLSDTEQSIIKAAMAKTKGSVAGAARMLGLQRTTLVEKIKKLDS